MARLTVNGSYAFRFDADQEVKTEWLLELPRTDDQQLEVTKFKGHLGWSDRKDEVVLEGRLPASLAVFGDLSLVSNGEQRDIPLLSLKGFRDALARGREVVYKSDGTKVVVDFGKGKWSAEFRDVDVHRLMAPRWGGVRLAVKVGGRTVCSVEHPIVDFTTKLSTRPASRVGPRPGVARVPGRTSWEEQRPGAIPAFPFFGNDLQAEDVAQRKMSSHTLRNGPGGWLGPVRMACG